MNINVKNKPTFRQIEYNKKEKEGKWEIVVYGRNKETKRRKDKKERKEESKRKRKCNDKKKQSRVYIFCHTTHSRLLTLELPSRGLKYDTCTKGIRMKDV